MLMLKSCPRCGGDLHINRDIYGDYRECLQCGLMEDIENPRGIFAAAVAKTNKGKKKVA